MIFNPFDDLSYGEKLQDNRFCKFAIAAAVVGIAATAYSVSNQASASGSSGSSAGTGQAPGTKTTSEMPNQTPLTLTDSKAAAVYNPTDQMNKWTDIFHNMGLSNPDTAIPKIDTTSDDPNVNSEVTTP